MSALNDKIGKMASKRCPLTLEKIGKKAEYKEITANILWKKTNHGKTHS